MSLNKSTIDSVRKHAFADKKVKNDFRILMEKQFRTAHRKLMESFEKHAVTRELKGGPGAENITGGLKDGNLFGFIGFDADQDPISPLQKALERANILIHKSNSRTFTHTFRVSIPTKEELYQITPLPWKSGASWLHALEERGLSNLGQYAFSESSNSRSGAGIQTNTLKGGALRISYLNPMLEEFERGVSNIAGFKIK